MNGKVLKIMGLFLVAAALVMTPFFFNQDAQASNEESLGTVSVSGSGSISVKPDTGIISVGVETENPDASTAQEENKEKMNKVMKALEELNIAEENIKTIAYSLNERYNYYEDQTKEKYYVSSHILQVKINDIDKIGRVIDAVTKAGSNQISNIQFSISNEEEIYAQALELAMESAKTKADAILGTFGKVSTLPSKVTENGYSMGTYRQSYEAVMEDSSTPISAGELSIQAHVTVEYNY